MYPGIVVGRVWSTRKYKSTENIKLLLVQPTDWYKNPKGDVIVAADAVGAGAGEFVFYVKAREACFPFCKTLDRQVLDEMPPYDSSIVGIIDGVNLRTSEDI